MRMISKKRPLTLLELMLALLLIALIGGIVGIRMGDALAERRFHASLDRLYVELEACRRLALSAQVDWVVRLEKKANFFFLQKSCPELGEEKKTSWKSPCEMRFNGKAIQTLSFQFTSSGKVSPAGQLTFEEGKKNVSWRLPDRFEIFEQGGLRS